MSRWLTRWLLCLYPRRWRDRYAEEFLELLQSSQRGPRLIVDVICAATKEHIFSMRGAMMTETGYSFRQLSQEPSAFVPLAMSVVALTLALLHVGANRSTMEMDEGAAAHTWQLLMAAQLPVLAFFALRWLPRAPRQTVKMLGLQAGAAVANLAVVYFAGLG